MKILHFPKYIRIVVLYFVFAILWVLITDHVVTKFTDNPDVLTDLQNYKGIVFVVITAVLLYFERKHADKAQKKSEEQFRTVADFAYDWEYWRDPDGRFLYVSPSCERITGYRPDEFMTDPELVKRIIHPDDYKVFLKHIHNERKRGEISPMEFRIITRSGEERWISHVCQQVYNAQGNLLGFRVSNRDITERKQYEELERIQREELAHADKMIILGTLVSGVAHEINNPTNFITLNTPILREFWYGTRPILDEYYQKEGDFHVGRFKYSALRERMDQLLDGVAEGAERIKQIVTDLKDFARPDPSDMNQTVDTNQVITNTVTLLRESIEKHTKHFQVNYGDTVPTIIGSPQKLEQVMINLIQNSLESLSDEEKAVSVSSRYDDNNKAIVIEIKDEGCGINEEILPRILDPFFTTKRTSGGTGIGLSIAARIVKNHDGELTFSSGVGKGTIANIILPVTDKRKEVT